MAGRQHNSPGPDASGQTDRFVAPTSDQVDEHLQRYRARIRSPWLVRLPFVFVVVVVLLSFWIAGIAGRLLPWLAVAGLFIYLVVRLRDARSLERMAGQLHDLAMLRHHRQVLRRAWRMIPNVVSSPMLHARIVALLSHCLDHVKAYDAAIVGYDYLLERLPPDHPSALQLNVQRAIAALSSDRLTEADDGLRRLRGAIDPYARTPVGAAYQLAVLFQQVCTYHYDDAVARTDDLLAQLRPLGVDAGYGHALMALCYHHRRGGEGQADRHAEATWWRRATLLLPKAALVNRFPQLTPLAGP